MNEEQPLILGQSSTGKTPIGPDSIRAMIEAINAGRMPKPREACQSCGGGNPRAFGGFQANKRRIEDWKRSCEQAEALAAERRDKRFTIEESLTWFDNSEHAGKPAYRCVPKNPSQTNAHGPWMFTRGEAVKAYWEAQASQEAA